MGISSLVVDDWLPDPDHIRKQALQLDYHPHDGEFPGIRSAAADGDYQLIFKMKIESVLPVKISEFVYDSFCFQLVYENEKTWIHRDGCDWAGVLFLTPNAPLESGTGLFREKEEDSNEWEMINAMGNVYNRMILYKGNIDHSSMMPGFGTTPETGRLTQVFFFNAEDTGGFM